MTARNGAGRANGVPSGLTDELVDVLAVVDDAPPGFAEATIALLPYGSRSSLVAHGIIERMDGGSGDAVAIGITAEGRAVIAACARPAPASRGERPAAVAVRGPAASTCRRCSAGTPLRT